MVSLDLGPSLRERIESSTATSSSSSEASSPALSECQGPRQHPAAGQQWRTRRLVVFPSHVRCACCPASRQWCRRQKTEERSYQREGSSCKRNDSEDGLFLTQQKLRTRKSGHIRYVAWYFVCVGQQSHRRATLLLARHVIVVRVRRWPSVSRRRMAGWC
jgi:hypothetical protein